MASERCKKILKNVRLRRRLRFDIEPNSADCEQVSVNLKVPTKSKCMKRVLTYY